MKNYYLWDCYEGYGYISDYDTEAEARAAAKEWYENTDGECQIMMYAYCAAIGGYKPVISA